MPQSQGRLKKIIQSIQNMFGLQVCVKRRSSSVSEADEKLLNMFNDLTVGISEVFDDDRKTFEDFLRCDRVSCKVNILSEQIGQVRIMYSLWKNGFDLDPDDITAKCQSLNLLVDCIRDDVFHAYLRMPPEQKLELLRKNKQVSSIFAVLGGLENEVTDMVKTMLPNGEIMKLIRPLLKPKFNKMLFRRCAQRMMDGHSTSHYYQAIQFCCGDLPFEKPVKVDACTDPITAKEWVKTSCVSTDYGDVFYSKPAYSRINFENYNQFSNLVAKKSHPTISSNAKLRPIRSISDHQIEGAQAQRFESTDFRNEQVGTSKDRLSIVTDMSDVCLNDTMFEPNQTQQNPISADRKNDLSFWKLAAELIAGDPLLD